MGIQKNEKIIANFIQKMAKRKLPFNDFSITKATAPWCYGNGNINGQDTDIEKHPEKAKIP